MTLNQFFLILKARRPLAACLFLLIVSLAVALTLIMPKRYTATAAVVLDVKSPDPIAGMILPGMIQPGYMATQLDLIVSERVVEGAIASLDLGKNPDLRALWQEETGGAPQSFEPWLTTMLLKKMDAKPSKDSNVISVSFKAPDATYAAAVVNALVDSYIRTTAELRVEPAKQYRELFDQQVRQAQDRLATAQAKASDYQRDHGLIGTDEHLDAEMARLGELTTQLVAVQDSKAESGSRNVQAAASGDHTQEALANAVVSNLQTDLARMQARLGELQSTLGEANPQVVQLRANIADTQVRIAAETSKVSASLAINNVVNADRESQLRSAVEQQRQKLLGLRAERDQAQGLVKEVDAAQDALNLMQARRDQTSIESQSTQTNVSIVQRATPPYEPSSPKIVINMLLAIVVGFVFAIGSVVLLELWDRRLRADEDVGLVLGVPLLGVMLSAPTRGSPALAMGGYAALNRMGDARRLPPPRNGKKRRDSSQ